MFNKFTIALHLGGVMEFGDITKYTGYHVEYLHRCKSMVVNYNAIVKAVLDLGYSVKKLWYATLGDSLRSGLVQIVSDDQVLELVGLRSSFGVIEVHIEGATLGDDSGSTNTVAVNIPRNEDGGENDGDTDLEEGDEKR
ncbi:hypothetical protein ACJRO7_022599 [Eucalyptus globulus]|uniref:PB1-like domain-containing protein n=1 Tax=Eucalyptus globulus TaxID=34317 RepID=A0ABD3JZD7_EUCGL